MTRLAAVLALALLPAPGAAQVAEPDGYRMDSYRAPVPETLAGATVISPGQAHDLWQAGAVFVDVLPRAPRPDSLPEGTIWNEKPRLSVPGAVWLPNVGYGAIADVTDAYFRAGLAQAAPDPATPVVFFCLAECWMSWNAAKRALEYGYGAVHWMPDGTDGWVFHDYPTAPVVPWQAP